MSVDIIAFLIAAFGASLEEIFYWRELRTKLANPKYHELLTSPVYWLVTMGSICAAAVGALIWYAGQHPAPKDLLLAGAAFPLIFKRAIATFSTRQHLGMASAGRARRALAIYFQSNNIKD